MQDLIFSTGSLVFIMALFPSILQAWDQKPAVSTSLLTGGVLFVFGATYVTLDLPLAAITTFITAILWSVLAFQKWTGPPGHPDSWQN
jgi:hypothetical protein